MDWETGELVYSDEKRRLQKWEMQAAVRALLPDSRVRICYRDRLHEDVRVYRRDTLATYYRGLRVCGKVWECPVCAGKVAERKRAELDQAVRDHQAQGGGVLLLTLTVPHTARDEAFGLVDRLLKAFRAFGQGKKAWTAVLPGYLGSVRALEVTHGANGWHPHLHVLVFTGGEIEAGGELQAELLARWAKVVERHKLGEVNHHGLRLDDGKEAGNYVGKWGMVDEVTRAHTKQGRKGGRTPWALLADYIEGDKAAGRLFRDFAGAFRGKSQLSWSRGLRKRLGLVQEKDDQELAEEVREEADVFAARLSAEDWKLVRKNELRGRVLELLRTETWEAVRLLLDHYRAPKGSAARATVPTRPRELDPQRAAREPNGGEVRA